MYEAYTQNKDLYAIIAQSAFDNEYWENLEFYPEGYEIEIDGQKIICGKKTHLNKAGKERRSIGKLLNLATCYGMSGSTAGARMGKTKEEGQQLLDSFFNGFPKVKEAIDNSKNFLRKNGYVEDFVGRRRRLDDINLPKYVVTLKDQAANSNFNPFIICTDRVTKDPLIIKWEAKVAERIAASQAYQRKQAEKNRKTWTDNGEMSNKQFTLLAAEALKEGVIIQANTGRIAQAERQCFNARIQGSAATLTKIAMVKISRDKTLNDCDTKLIIPVHDELLVECPAFYADIVEKRLPEVMISAAMDVGDDVPQSCDPFNVNRWYCDEYAAVILDEFKKLEKGDDSKGVAALSRDEALAKVIANHTELPQSSIIKTIETGCDLEF